MLAGQRAPFIDRDIGWIPMESVESRDKYGAIRGRSGFSVSLISSIAKNRIEVCAGVIRISKVDVLGQISVRQDFRRFEECPFRLRFRLRTTETWNTRRTQFGIIHFYHFLGSSGFPSETTVYVRSTGIKSLSLSPLPITLGGCLPYDSCQ